MSKEQVSDAFIRNNKLPCIVHLDPGKDKLKQENPYHYFTTWGKHISKMLLFLFLSLYLFGFKWITARNHFPKMSDV